MARAATDSRRLVRLTRVGAAIGACLIAYVQPFAHAADPVFDPGFSYVDVNHDQMFDEDDGDVALVAGEVADGRFDTRRTEGGYKKVVRDASLVILTTPAARPRRISYRTDATLVIAADLSAKHGMLLRARDAVFIGTYLDGSTTTLRARRIAIRTRGSIFSDMDVFEGVGRGSRVSIQSQQNFVLSNGVFVADRSVKVNSKRGRAGIVGCRLAACAPRGRVRVLAFGIADARAATLRAHKTIQIRGSTFVDLSDASAAIVDGSENGTIQINGERVVVDGATILAPNGPRIQGEQSLTPTLIGEGTLPCAADG